MLLYEVSLRWVSIRMGPFLRIFLTSWTSSMLSNGYEGKAGSDPPFHLYHRSPPHRNPVTPIALRIVKRVPDESLRLTLPDIVETLCPGGCCTVESTVKL